MTQTEALKALIHEMEYVLSCINEDKIPFDGDDFHEALRLGKEALANHIPDTTKMVSQPEQEPVAWWVPKAEQFCLPSSDGTRPFAKAWEPLYTTPPQRTWVGLTDEETAELVHRYAFYELTRQIETKLKEKNT